jgi:WD40 repeat protein
MKSPFKFLDSYTKDDREIFFGREREIEELYHRVFESKIMLVYGVSGTGKSSLIHCGLANKFLETDWLPLVIRRGGNIIESMATAIKAASITALQANLVNPSDFKKGVRSLYLDHYKPVFFIFDQFEELFIFGDKEERRSFIHIVKTLTESDLQCRMIFIMREEYMAGVTEFEKFIPTFFSNRVRIEKMSHRNAIEAIKGPCNIFNISLEEGFAESLLEKLSPGSEDVELTYLQVFLDKIFRLAIGFLPPPGGESKGGSSSFLGESKGGLSFTLSLLQKTGNVSDLLGSFLDEQISLMEYPETAMNVLKTFVSGKGTKRSASEQEAIDNIKSFGKEISSDTIKELILAFVKLRVLKDKDDNDRYELRHDALAEKIFEKFSTAEKELLEIRQFIENSYQVYLKRKVLLNNDDLNYISNKDSQMNLSLNLIEFLSKSRKYIQYKIKTVKRLTYISSLAFVIVIGFLGYYISTKGAQVSANMLAIRSINQIKDPAEKLKVANSAWENSHDVLAKEALLKAFNEILNSHESDSSKRTIIEKYKLKFDVAPVPILFAKCSDDNQYICGYGDSLLMIWNREGNLETSITLDYFPIIDLKISSDNKYIGVISHDSTLTIFDMNGGYKFSHKLRYNKLNSRQAFTFTRNNNVLSLAKNYDAILFDPEGKVLQTFNHHTDIVNAVDISGDGNFIATSSCDKTICIWYLNSLKNSYEYYNTLNYHRDTVWSVSFSERNVTVLSASADKMVLVGTINGEIKKKSQRYIGKSNFRSDNKYSDAYFSKSNDGIIAVSYSTLDNKIVKHYIAKSYRNPLINLRTDLIYGQAKYIDQNEEYDFMAFSPDEKYFLFLKNGLIYLCDNVITVNKEGKRAFNSNHILCEMIGSIPFFTSDSKYILWINGDSIQSYFIDPAAINEETRKFIK